MTSGNGCSCVWFPFLCCMKASSVTFLLFRVLKNYTFALNFVEFLSAFGLGGVDTLVWMGFPITCLTDFPSYLFSSTLFTLLM